MVSETTEMQRLAASLEFVVQRPRPWLQFESESGGGGRGETLLPAFGMARISREDGAENSLSTSLTIVAQGNQGEMSSLVGLSCGPGGRDDGGVWRCEATSSVWRRSSGGRPAKFKPSPQGEQRRDDRGCRRTSGGLQEDVRKEKGVKVTTC